MAFDDLASGVFCESAAVSWAIAARPVKQQINNPRALSLRIWFSIRFVGGIEAKGHPILS